MRAIVFFSLVSIAMFLCLTGDTFIGFAIWLLVGIEEYT